jgi:hypothetical protein
LPKTGKDRVIEQILEPRASFGAATTAEMLQYDVAFVQNDLTRHSNVRRTGANPHRLNAGPD